MIDPTEPPKTAVFEDDGSTPKKSGYIGGGAFLVSLKAPPKSRRVGDKDADDAARGATVDIPHQLLDGAGNPVWAVVYLDPHSGQIILNPHYGDREQMHRSPPPPGPSGRV